VLDEERKQQENEEEEMIRRAMEASMRDEDGRKADQFRQEEAEREE